MEPTEYTTAELVRRYQAGIPGAAEELFDRYVARLVALARSRLDRRMAGRFDAEDVVQSAYRSFFLRARKGEFELTRSGDLWRLLATITLRKLYRQVGRQRADRRSVEREQAAADDESRVCDELVSRQPTPAEAGLLADELAAFMTRLNPLERQVLAMRLQDCTIEEIAREVQRGERTVRRALAAIRCRFAALQADVP